jgi:hypothetical protein
MRQLAIGSKVIPRVFDDEKKRSCLIAAASINCEFVVANGGHSVFERSGNRFA